MKGPITGFWAKYEDLEEGRVWHPLIAHCGDVAAVLQRIVEKTVLRRRLATLLGWNDLEDVHVWRIAALGFLHDLGKVNQGFQSRAFQENVPRLGHVRPMIDVLETEYAQDVLKELPIQEMLSWFEDEGHCVDALLATWGHHGRPVKSARQSEAWIWRATDARDPIAEVTKFGLALENWFKPAFGEGKSFPASPQFLHAYNGVLTLADWLGSDTRFFKFRSFRFEESEEYFDEALKLADDAIEKVGLLPKAREEVRGRSLNFETLFGFTPHDMQAKCFELESDAAGGLVILESDTGSGKTEAAVAHFHKLYKEGLVDGLYFALPTRAAATQLFGRVRENLKRVFDDPPPAVLAVPGYLRVDDAEGIALPKFKVRWPDNEDREIEHRGWSAQGPKRFLAAPVAVGTIDQVLLSSLKVSHAHMRGACLLRHLLVVDEVHSSDEYMTRLLKQVLEHHLGAGGHALLMSATLGTTARKAFLGQVDGGSADEAVATSYPLISQRRLGSNSVVTLTPTPTDYRKEISPRLEAIAEDPVAIATLALNAAAEGARVLVIRNRVDDCVETQQALFNERERRSLGMELLFDCEGIPVPHHSRFAAKDRKLLDLRIEQVFGRESSRNGVVAVATQTVEQSLDIDADLLLTDLCPIDVLLQRLGRLFRHEKRTRPAGYQSAKVVVVVPQERDVGSWIRPSGEYKGSAKGPCGLGTVYRDARNLEATWRLLEATTDRWVIPTDNRRLVEGGTHPEVLRGIVNELGDPWPLHDRWREGTWLADVHNAKSACLSWVHPFASDETLFPTNVERLKTRLGEEGHEVSFLMPVKGPFGTLVDGLQLPAWWFPSKSDMSDVLEASSVECFDGGFRFQAAGQEFQYDPMGVRRVESIQTTDGEE